MLSIPAFAAGAASWSLAEYVLHRFAGHGPRRKRGPSPLSLLTPRGLMAAFNEEHVAHHARHHYFAPTWKKAAAAAVAVPVLGTAASLLLGPRRGFSYAVGFTGAYLGYEWIHRRIHTHPPVSSYARWVYRNHLHHHVNPKTNHGVTSPVWDMVFGTYVPVARVELNVRMAPPWMVDERGELRPEHADDYELTSRRPAPAPHAEGAAQAA